MDSESPRVSTATHYPIGLLLIGYLGFVIVIGGLSAYPLYLLLTEFVSPTLPFHKLSLRWLELLALIGLVPVLLGSGGMSKVSWGLARTTESTSSAARHVLVGISLGVAMIGIPTLVLLSTGVRVVAEPVTLGLLLLLIIKGLISGLAVSLIEELWFRGGLQEATKRFAGLAFATITTAALYATVHFVKPRQFVEPEAVGWTSTWQVLLKSVYDIDPSRIVDSWSTLFVAGALLALLRIRSGWLWLGVGVHAGWVLAIRVTKGATALDKSADYAPMVGTFDGVIGWLTAGLFLLAFFVVACWPRLARGRAAVQTD